MAFKLAFDTYNSLTCADYSGRKEMDPLDRPEAFYDEKCIIEQMAEESAERAALKAEARGDALEDF